MLTFGDIGKEKFLSEFWQKKPCLIKNAFSDFHSPLTGDELAGLSMEDDASSRLIIGNPSENPRTIKVHHGPFDDGVFENLSDGPFSLLVQQVEDYIPSVAELKKEFSFLKGWFLDDVMVSYASDGGGVGPHVDYYDVFLLQAVGKRNWRIGKMQSKEPGYVSGIELRIMENFEVADSFELLEGDMLYLPPLVPHDGIAVGESLTVSVGFRAPSNAELLDHLLRKICANIPEWERFKFASETNFKSDEKNQICKASVDYLKNLLEEKVSDSNIFIETFGEVVTKNVRSGVHGDLEKVEIGHYESEWDEFMSELKSVSVFRLYESIRLATYRDRENLHFFIDGASFKFAGENPVLSELTNHRRISIETIHSQGELCRVSKQVLVLLFRGGCFYSCEAD